MGTRAHEEISHKTGPSFSVLKREHRKRGGEVRLRSTRQCQKGVYFGEKLQEKGMGIWEFKLNPAMERLTGLGGGKINITKVKQEILFHSIFKLGIEIKTGY